MNKLLRYTLQIALLAGLIGAQPVWAQGRNQNTPPVARDDEATVSQGNTVIIPVLKNDTDTDGDALSVQNVRRAKGVVRIQDDGTLLYRPTPNFVGEDDFEYTISDGNKGKASARVRVQVRAAQANQDPVAYDAAFDTQEEVAFSDTLPAFDADGDDLTYSIVNQGTKGTAVITDATTNEFTYTPDPDANDQDSFTFRVYDGAAYSNEATVTINIEPVNDAPVITSPATATATEDELFTYTATATDVDGDDIAFSFTDLPSWLAVEADGATVSGIPTEGFTSGSFTVTADDGKLSDALVVTITVGAVNDAPVFTSSPVTSAAEGSVYTYNITASDADEGAVLTIGAATLLAWLTLTDGGNGTAVLTGTPDNDDVGDHPVVLTLTDGVIASPVTQSFIITVSNVNDAPVAVDDTAGTPEDVAVVIEVLENDYDVDDGDLLTVQNVRQAQGKGKILIDRVNGTLLYTPSPNFSGTDIFYYTIHDVDGLTDEGMVTVTVGGVNDAPVADAQSVSTDEDTPLEIILTGSDPDEDALTYSVTSGPSHGALSGTAPNLTYTPASHYSGSDGFTFRVTDPGGLYDEATVTVLVNLAGDLAADEPVDPDEGGIVTTDIGVSIEIPGGSLGETVNIQIGTYEVLPPGAPQLMGTLYFFGPSGTTFDPPATITVPYDPDRLPPGFDPADLVLLIYSEIDGTWEEADSSTVNTDAHTVSGQTYHFSGFAAGLLLDRAPYCLGLPGISIDEDAQSTVILPNLADYFADPNFGDEIDFDATSLDNGLHAVYVINDSALLVEPRPNFNGEVRIVITATDLTGLWVSDTLFLTVTPDNDPPFFLANVADAYIISEDQLLRIDLSADDVEGDNVTFDAASDTSAVATAIVQDTTLLAVPIQNWYGTAHIIVSASDGQDITYLGPFILTVEPVNDLPSEFELLEPDALIQVETSQLDGSLTFTWEEVIDPDDSVNYTFTLNDTGAIYFEYDTTITATEVRVPYADIVSAIKDQGLKMATFEWTVVAIAGQDIIEASNGPTSLTVDINTLAVMDENHLPQFFALHQNYPNPFNPVTTLRYELPAYCQVLLVIYDMRGREVIRLVDGYKSAGYNRVTWNSGDAFGRPVPSGIYFARLITPEYTHVIKMSLIR